MIHKHTYLYVLAEVHVFFFFWIYCAMISCHIQRKKNYAFCFWFSYLIFHSNVAWAVGQWGSVTVLTPEHTAVWRQAVDQQC